MTSPDQLIELLSTLPGKIRDQEKVFIESKAVLDLAKLSLSVAKAQSILESTGNATEKNAQAVRDTEVEASNLIQAQKETDLEEAGLKYLENRFVSLRKVSSIETELMRVNVSGN